MANMILRTSNHRRAARAFCVALGGVSALALAPAMAQDAQSGLDEVTVTAQRRAENQQDVPVSVSTVPSARLDAYLDGAEDIRALATRVPGLYAESSNGRVAPRFYIRGLGNTDFDLAASQPVSVIMDDVVKENVILKSFPLFDVAQVEVLRGPQGTLFGRNTPAGIVKIDTAKPGDEFGGFLSASVGTYFTTRAEGAVGGPVGENISMRASALYQRRNDWIDNAYLAGADDVMGGFEEIAGRLQVLFTSGALEVHLSGHGRDIEGTSELFRANILGPGDNELNANFDRDTVWYDGGGNNVQQYQNLGGSARIAYDLGGATLSSITGYETANGTSRGDIDGGAFYPTGSFPGFIPFPSDTTDGLDNLSQLTQEIRVASNGDAALDWQLGFFYFDSDFQISTVGVGFPPLTTVRHDNQSWAAFGQLSYDFTDAFNITGGIRYTEDDKDFRALVLPPLVTVNPTSVGDERVSWDVAATLKASDSVNIYARVARGFRAPTIQGRDVAFAAFSGAVDPQSVATSETIQSYEAGFKSQFAGNRARLNASVFYYDANDLQFSAIGGASNSNRLINADGEAWGFEADGEFLLSDNFLMTGGVSYNNTEITEPGLLVAPCGGGCTVTDTVNGLGLALITGNPFPQAPEWTWNVTARWAMPTGNGNEFYVFTDWAGQGKTNFFLYESAEFNSSGNVEGGVKLGYAMRDGAVDFAIFARNILDAENVKGGIDFNNLTGFVNEPRIVGVSASLNF
jgi:outer membrane receptor protein involved in Fe transport